MLTQATKNHSSIYANTLHHSQILYRERNVVKMESCLSIVLHNYGKLNISKFQKKRNNRALSHNHPL